MGNITNWRSLSLGIGLLAAAIILPLAMIGQLYAADWGEAEKDVKVEKGVFIGIYPEDIDSEEAEALDYKGEGILVEDIVSDGPAEKAGLKAGDIITAIDSEKITGTDQFRKVLAKYSPGDKVKVSTVRDKAVKEFSVELAKRKEMERIITIGKDDHMKRAFLGVVTETVEGDFAEYFGVKEGALIKSIVEDSPAEKAGLKAGDVLVEIAGDKIESTDDVFEAMSDHKPGDSVKIKFMRKGKDETVELKLDKAPGSSSWSWDGLGGHKIIIADDDEVTIDTDELRRAVKEALKEVKIKMDESGEQLKKELDQLKVELEALKKDMETKKKETKEDKK